MGHKIKAVVLAISLVYTLPVVAEDRQVTPTVFYSSDSDRFEVFIKGVEFTEKHNEKYRHGVGVARADYTQDSWNDNITALTYLFDYTSDYHLFGKIGMDDNNYIVGSIEYEQKLNEYFTANIIGERQVVDSKMGLIDNVYYDLYGGVISYDSLKRFSAAAVFLRQEINDGNDRRHFRTRLTYTLSPEKGIHAHIRAKYMDSTQPSRGIYFNPDDYKRTMIGLSMRRWYDDGSMFNIGGYVGKERVDNYTNDTVQMIEVEYRKPFNERWHLSLSGIKLLNSNSYTYTHVYLNIDYNF